MSGNIVGPREAEKIVKWREDSNAISKNCQRSMRREATRQPEYA